MFDNVYIRDYSIFTGKNAKNKDVAYARKATAESWLNIRDGNSLIEVYDKDTFKSISVARQGLPKFFSLNYDFIEAKSRYQTHKNTEQRLMQHQILAPVQKALLQGNAIEIVRSLKTNGDNV